MNQYEYKKIVTLLKRKVNLLKNVNLHKKGIRLLLKRNKKDFMTQKRLKYSFLNVIV